MKQLLPVALVVAAIFLHFFYCEWDVYPDVRKASSSYINRTIYFSSKQGTNVIYVLAKSPKGMADAKLYGILIPGLLVGGASTMSYFQQRSGRVGDF